MLYGVSCSQTIWYLRSYPGDPLAFKLFVMLIWSFDTVTFFITVANAHYLLIRRGVGEDPYIFLYCDHWSYNGILVTTEVCCCLIELFFVMRMWRFAERKRLSFLAFLPYTISAVFNIVYLRGMFKHSCYPDMLVNNIWLILCYSFKILTDGIIAGSMTWLLWARSRGIRRSGGTIRVIRELIYWSVSTGLLLWVSTLFHVLTYFFLSATYVGPGSYLIRSRVYFIAMMAVVNDRRRHREVLEGPETISLRVTTNKQTEPLGAGSRFWRSMAEGSREPNSSVSHCSAHHPG